MLAVSQSLAGNLRSTIALADLDSDLAILAKVLELRPVLI